MTELKYYLKDGANWQAKAVLSCLQGMGDIEESWNKEYNRYDAEINVARWENCREQGYVVMLKSRNMEQLNIAFFEHRNSDSIHAVKWKQNTINTPSIDMAKFVDVYSDKWDTSFSVSYGEFLKISEWIFNELKEFWTSNDRVKDRA